MSEPPPDPRAKREMDLWDTFPKEWREAFGRYPTCFRSSDYVRAMRYADHDIANVQEVLRAMDPWVPQEGD